MSEIIKNQDQINIAGRIDSLENAKGDRISPTACSCFHPWLISPGIPTAARKGYSREDSTFFSS